MTKSILNVIVVLGILILFPDLQSFSQVGISTDNSIPDNSAILDVKSTSKGMLIPRMTQLQIAAITGPANGMLVWCTTDNKLYAYVSGENAWKELLYGPGTISFTCGNPINDCRDSKTYSTVQIGTQCWMAQNLNIGTKINCSAEQTNNANLEKYCYNNLESNCDVYGGFYQWDEAMQYTTTEGVQGICLTGWHLPTDAEFTVLASFLGGEEVAGGKMKESGYLHWSFPNQSATNESGFTGLPAGRRNINGNSEFTTLYLYIWSSTTFNSSIAWERSLNYYYAGLARASDYVKTYGFSVRCLKN